MANYNRNDFLLQSIFKIVRSRKSKHSGSGPSAYPAANEGKQYHYSFLKDLIVTSIFWIIGIGCLLSGYSQTVEANKIMSQGNKAMATVTNVFCYEVEDADGSYSDERDVSLSYTANGQEYDCVIQEANIYKDVGEQTEIYYDSNDPTIMVSSEHLNSKVTFLKPMGIALCAFALFLHLASWITARRSRSRRRSI